MKINIYTPDSKMPNLAAMKIAAWHKANGDHVTLNFPLQACDMSYASLLFKWTADPIADIVGGPKYPDKKLDPEFDAMMPDYSIYPGLDYSIGFTYKACPRSCDFCIVPLQNNTDKHYSIWTFHKKEFNKICLLNNNTLADPYWRDTFNEIIDAKLKVIDHNGYDARLITEEAAEYISKIKFEGGLHLAWDYPEHEKEVVRGIQNLQKFMPSMFRAKRIRTYVLIGHTTHEENIHRVMILEALKAEPFIMKLNKDDQYQSQFARWVNRKAIFKTVSWNEYQGGRHGQGRHNAFSHELYGR